MLIPSYIHILCFGDSLTQGFTKGGNIHHPYSLSLQSILEKSFPSTSFRMEPGGRDGDQATSPPGAFVPRMDILYQEIHPYDPFDYAVIMGGTNDLNGGRQPDDIYAELQRTWAIPLSHGTKVLALTVPDCGLCGQDFANRMNKLNSLILNHKADNL
jgi:lysophospholipase L1-like esterase